MQLSDKCKKYIFPLQKALHKEKIDLVSLLKRESAEGLSVIEVLQMYEVLQFEESGDLCTLIADPEYDEENRLIYGEFARYDEVFPQDMVIGGTYYDVLKFAENYAIQYKSNHPGVFDTYQLVRLYDYLEIEHDYEYDIREHIETLDASDVLPYIEDDTRSKEDDFEI